MVQTKIQHRHKGSNTKTTQTQRYTHILSTQTPHKYYQHRHTGTHTNTIHTKRYTHKYNTDTKIHTHTVILVQRSNDDVRIKFIISGIRPPRPAYTPSPNGNPHMCEMIAVNQSSHPVSSKWQSRLQDMLTPSSSRAYAMGCAIITLLLLTVFLIFYFLGEISY